MRTTDSSCRPHLVVLRQISPTYTACSETARFHRPIFAPETSTNEGIGIENSLCPYRPHSTAVVLAIPPVTAALPRALLPGNKIRLPTHPLQVRRRAFRRPGYRRCRCYRMWETRHPVRL